MALQHKTLGKTYLRYLFAGLGSAVIVSIYSIVDAIMVGKYEGSNGTAALSIVMPIWTIILSLGLLFGVGGGSLMSKARGEGDEKRGREIFTVAFICAVVVALLIWGLLLAFENSLLRLFGADDSLLPLAKKYLKWMKFSMPLFTMGQFLSCFIRNDNAPTKAMAAVITGGVFNIGGDYFFVFVRDMGAEGAGLATALGQVLAICILVSHFFSRQNGLKFVRPKAFFRKASAVFIAGFSVFVVDLAMGILTMLFNNQIMKYLGADALAVYGVIINVSVLVQSLSYGVGQAAQPIVSQAYGAGEKKNIYRIERYGIFSALILGIVAFAVAEILPLPIVRGFMETNVAIEEIAPNIFRVYALSFLLLPVNIFFTYYYQAIMRPIGALTISLIRGIFLSGLLILLLPVLFDGAALWWVMPVTEILTFGVGLIFGRKYRFSSENIKEKSASVN